MAKSDLHLRERSGRAPSSGATGLPSGCLCKFEHILSPDVTDRICTLLGHPLECPHGSPIPQGPCCIEKRVLDHIEIADVLSGIKAI
jgi:hypothetical protein